MRTGLRSVVWPLAGVALFNLAALAVAPRDRPLTFHLASDAPREAVYGVPQLDRLRTRAQPTSTAGRFGAVLAGLDRRHDWTLSARVQTPVESRAEVTVQASLDGRPGLTFPIGPDLRTLVMPIPAAPVAGARLDFVVISDGLPPLRDGEGPGLLLTDVRLEPERPSWIWPPATTTFAGLAFGIIASVYALPWAAGLIWLPLSAFGYGWLSTLGWGPLIDWPVLTLAVQALVPTAAAALLLARSTLAPVGARLVVVSTFALVFFQLMALAHPHMPPGNAIFHAHRLEEILEGRRAFASAAPGAPGWPAAIGLYLLARPIASAQATLTEQVALLRTLAVIANAVAAALLYRVVMRWRSDDTSGAAAALAYHLMPVTLGTIIAGDLTVSFAQSAATMAVAAIALLFPSSAEGPPALRIRGQDIVVSAVVTMAIAEIAFLSHISTMLVLIGQLVMISAALIARPGTRRSNGIGLLAATAVAAAIAGATHYVHWLQVAHASVTTTAGGIDLPEAAGETADLFRLMRAGFSWPALGLAGFGAFTMLVERRERSLVPTIIAASIVVPAIAFAVARATQIELRPELAALPAIALLAAAGFGAAWQAGTFQRSVAVVVLGSVAWLGGADVWRLLQ
jgi:hypothetical protein